MGRNFCVLKGESKPRFIFLQAGKAEAGPGGRAETQQREGPLGGPLEGAPGGTLQDRCGNVSPVQDAGGGSQGRVRHTGHCGDTNPRRSEPEKPQFLRKDKVFP